MAPAPQKNLQEELAEWLEFEDSSPGHWVVCGGVAMALQGLNTRTTRDVDVLADWDATGKEVACIDEFPEDVRRCVDRVVQAHPELRGLKKNWVNLGPRKLVGWGLPEGFEARMTTINFGHLLTLHLLGREDLLALKLYAAADEFGTRQGVHVNDLRVLEPTFYELDVAVDWIRLLPDYVEKRQELKEKLCELGYDDLACYV
jgi:hypothetical protein